jgi:hypothetical protein
MVAADRQPTSASCRGRPRHPSKTTASVLPPRWGRFFVIRKRKRPPTEAALPIVQCTQAIEQMLNARW